MIETVQEMSDERKAYLTRQIKSASKKIPSNLGLKVADLLDDVFDGIYHLESNLNKVNWDCEYYIKINLTMHSLSTYDFSILTDLVILCHDRCLRCELQAVAPKVIKLQFHQRQREGSIFEKHPTIEEAINRVRSFSRG